VFFRPVYYLRVRPEHTHEEKIQLCFTLSILMALPENIFTSLFRNAPAYLSSVRDGEKKVFKLWRQILLQCWAKMPTDRPTFEALKDFLMETAPSVVKAVQSFQEENKLVSLNIYSIKVTICPNLSTQPHLSVCLSLQYRRLRCKKNEDNIKHGPHFVLTFNPQRTLLNEF
jgi:hypothetical protein